MHALSGAFASPLHRGTAARGENGSEGNAGGSSTE